MGVFIIIINGSSFALSLYYSPIVRGFAQGGQRQSVPGNRRSKQKGSREGGQEETPLRGGESIFTLVHPTAQGQKMGFVGRHGPSHPLNLTVVLCKWNK